jgi:hypothetical protein
VVGRFVEQQDIWFFKQQAAKRHPTAFTARQLADVGIAGRAAQRLHRDLELVIERPAVDRIDLPLKIAHLFHQRIEIGVVLRIAHLRGNRVEAVDQIRDRAHAILDVAHHVL